MLRRRAHAVLPALLLTVAAAAPAAAGPAPAAAPSRPASGAPVGFLTYNICGNSPNTADCSATREVEKRRDAVVAHARAEKSDFVFLQEVCSQQFATIGRALKGDGYDGHFAETFRRPGVCDVKEPDGTVTKGVYGIAVYAKGPITPGEAVTIDPDDDYTRQHSGPEAWHAACVEAEIRGRKTRGCSVHLYPQYDGKPPDINARQAANLAAHPWLDAGTPVVLGGDFNPLHRTGTIPDRTTSPRSTDLDPFYRPELGGSGRLIEVDETDAARFDATCKAATPRPRACRSGEPTHLRQSAEVKEAKLDYIFVDRDHFGNVRGDALPRDSEISDHYALVGSATVRHDDGDDEQR
ncbi:endonuclease/exonuclease/phosphatase family protein [Streptomyces sp. WAC 06738]|uniref:endonuclease/exonuclease/phosphatase family protein n=1 Tax=Streptomyces sp. WAC 06738 TaxID=2203210 RepID=UPI001F0C9BBC|nr:endonuclease/exonuclease/phosphatase family protein [Streptomyces sp. WAC 06738]